MAAIKSPSKYRQNRNGLRLLILVFGAIAASLGYFVYATQKWLQANQQKMHRQSQNIDTLIKDSQQASKEFDKKIKAANQTPWKPLGDGYVPPPALDASDDYNSSGSSYYSGSTPYRSSSSYSSSSYRSKTIRVRGYTRRDGTYVRSHYRSRRR